MNKASDKPFIEIDAEDFILPAFEVTPIDGYEAPDKFPFCCRFHTTALDRANKWLDKFPGCCSSHQKMSKKEWFKKSNYENVPSKILNQLSFTEHHICKQITSKDWYDDITDYIDYNVAGFGQPANGLHLYFEYVKVFLAKAKDKNLTKDKRQRLADYIQGYYTPKANLATDFNLLYSTYQKWLSAFPFEISYLKDFEVRYKKQLPFLDGKPKYNKYTGTSKAKLQTSSKLVETLLKLTEDLLYTVNGLSLYEKGLISDPEKIQLELINENRRIELSELNEKPCSDRQKYIKVIKEWLKGEKEYFKEIAPILNKIKPIQDQTTKFTQNNIPIKSEIEKMYEVPVIDLDIDKYVNWALDKKATDEEKDTFPNWRNAEYQKKIKFLQFKITGNPLPVEEVRRLEKVRIYEEINNLYSSNMKDLYDTFLPSDFYKLANLAGIIDYLKFLEAENLTPQQIAAANVERINYRQGNNLIQSTIEDSLLQFKDDGSIKEADYNSLITLLNKFFENEKVVTLPQSVFVKNGNKKNLGYALGEIFKSLKNEALSFEYLELGKKNISIYKDEEIDKTKFNKSNLYKYYTTKPQ